MLDAAGGAVIAGTSWTPGVVAAVITTLRYDAAGQLQQACVFPSLPTAGPAAHYGRDVALDAAGDVYVLGWREASSANDAALLVRYGAAGNVVWSRELVMPHSPDITPAELVVAPDGRATYLATIGVDAQHKQLLTAQYDSDGTLRWMRTYGSVDGAHLARALTRGADAHVRVAGYGFQKSGLPVDIVTLEYDENGVELWVRRHASTLGIEAEAHDIELSSAGVLNVAGFESATFVGTDTLLLRYDAKGFQLLGSGTSGSGGFHPRLEAAGVTILGGSCALSVRRALGGASAVLVLGYGPFAHLEQPLFGGTLHVLPATLLKLALSGVAGTPGAGSALVPFAIPPDPSLAGLEVRSQVGVLDAGASAGVALTNALEIWIG